jgi:ribosomal protein S15P/S13E
MRKLLVSVAVAAATLAAVPAAAQYQRADYGWNHRGPDRRAVQHLLGELAQVDQRITRSARRGIISPREAFSLRRQANQIRTRLHRSGRDGLSRREFANLQVQVNRLQQRVRHERRDLDGRRG